jgi:uncharacterized membrane protein
MAVLAIRGGRMDVLRSVRRFVAQEMWAQMLCVSVVVFAVYALSRRTGNPYNQYVLLTDAFLHGRLHLVDPPAFLEIARFGDKAFVIDPPAPVLFLLPFVSVFGARADHVLISCGVGALAVGFVWVAARRLWPDARFALAMTVLVAFGTNFWWLASDGGFWSFAHVSAVFFLAAGLAEATGERRPGVVALCVGLAGLSRLAVFLIAPLYLWFVLQGDLRIKRENVVRTLRFGAVLGLAALVYLTYNVARYGTFTDQGYYHPQYIGEPWFDRGRFDITYVPRHLRAIFYEFPTFGGPFPFVRAKYVGTALALTTPAFLYAFRARLTARNLAAIVGLVLVSTVLLTHGAVGFSQFGYRFAMDALPCLLLLTASGMRERISRVGLALIAWSVLANMWGMLAFNHFGWVV